MTAAPYYSDDLVTLYHGDALADHREWLTADVLVTDPPYGIDWGMNGGGRGAKYRGPRDAGIPNDANAAARDLVLSLFGDRPAVVFGSLRAPFPAKVKQVLIWKKPADAGVIGSTTGYRTDAELVFLTGPHVKRPASRSSVLETAGGKMRYLAGHPHGKPPAVMERLIEWTEGTIADPFAGAGATLIAAKNLGRRAIGVELEEKYCEIAARRLQQGAFDFAALS